MRRIALRTVLCALGLLLIVPSPAAAGEEENKELVRRMIEAMNARDFDALDEIVAPDLRRHSAATPELDVRSLAEFKEFLREDLSAVPDAEQELDRMIADGDMVAVRVIYRGTQTGPMGPFPPSAKKVEIPFIGMARIEDGKIAELWVEWDNLAALTQLGHLPPPEAPAAGEGEPPGPGDGPAIDLADHRLVDLTYAFDEDTIYWPTSPAGFELETLHHGPTEGGWFYSAHTLSAPEHGGTHMDAPIHFAEGVQSVDEVPLGRLVGPAVVVDVAAKAAEDPDYRLTPADVAAFEAEHGAIPGGAIVLLRTGWGARWGDRLRYLGDDTPGDASNLHFPAYGEEAARLLVEERGVAVLGLDTASLDHGPATDFPVHRVAAAANVPGLENVANLDELPPTGAWVIALPMKIAGGSGGPVRIAALVPR